MASADRGQSELVGFVLIFSIVLLAVVLLGITGFAGIDRAQMFQQSTNAEQAFSAFADNTNEHLREGAPTRSTEIGISDAKLLLDEPDNLTVHVDGEEVAIIEAHPLVYETGEATAISYAFGAVIREDGGSGVMQRSPNFVLTEEHVILPVANTTGSAGDQVSGTSSIQVQTQRMGDTIHHKAHDGNHQVEIEITSPRATTWQRYLEDAQGVTSCDMVAEETVSCAITTDAVLVTETTIGIRFR